ncbi:MAG: PstS family phosphate ABC transporter substrate-binding protein [Halanaeroarchaeum sp.]
MSDQAEPEPSVVTRRKFLAGVGAAGATAIAGCGGGGGGSTLSGLIQIAGSSTVFPISQRLTELFKKKHSEVSLSVKSTGTGAGFSNFFCKGRTDINDASRPIQPSEKQLCQKNDVEPVEFQIATDALTVVTSNNNDWVDCLSFEELREIWGPKKPVPQQWSDVHSKWPNKDMHLYGASTASGTFDFFTEKVMGEEGAHRQDYQQTEHDNTIVTGVSGDRYAMGYFGFAFYVENKDKLTALGIKKGDGKCIKPSFETAKTGKYPLSRPLFIYVAKSALEEEAVRKFVRYYIKKSKTETIRKIGYVPVTEKTASQNLKKLDRVVNEVTS